MDKNRGGADMMLEVAAAHERLKTIDRRRIAGETSPCPDGGCAGSSAASGRHSADEL